jgi:hypothetical protein
MKKVVSYILVALVLIFTIVAILGIWGIIDLKNVMMNTIFSLIVIFAASAVILFIYTVFMKDSDQKTD